MAKKVAKKTNLKRSVTASKKKTAKRKPAKKVVKAVSRKASARKPSAKKAARTLPGKSATHRVVKPKDVHAIRSEIAAVHELRGRVWLERDAEGYLSNYWDEAVLVVDGSRTRLPELRQWLHSTLAAGGGSLDLDLPAVDDIAVNPLGDAVTTIFEWRQRFRTADGEVSDRTYCETNVWYRRDGVWKIIRMHITTITKEVISAAN
jgi:ketosteroid isomerase-like protein